MNDRKKFVEGLLDFSNACIEFFEENKDEKKTSHDAIVEKMEWFLSHPEETAAMGRKGREMAEQIFDVRKVNAVICEAMRLSGSDRTR